MQVELDSVPLVSGQKVNLHGRFVAHGKEWENKALQNLAEANVVPGDPVEVGAGILFIFWFASSRGKEADLNIGTKVVASVDGDISLDRAAFEHLQEPQPPKTPGMAAVYIFRSPSSTGGLIDPAIYCGNVQLAAIKNGSFLKVFLPPATYWFHAGDERGVSLRVDDGQDYYLSVAMTIGNSGFSFVGDLTEVTAGNAKDRLANLPALDPQQVTDLSKVDPSALRVAMPE